MKPENLINMSACFRLKRALRLSLAALAAHLRRLAGLAARVWRVAGYYIALAVLLTALGSAAYAYRQRPRRILSTQDAGATPAPVEEAAVLSAQVVWPQPSPQPTPVPFCLIPPVPGAILQGCALDAPVWSETLGQWQTHPGLDFAAETGEAVYAAEAGEICAAYRDALLGNTVELRHDNGWITRYAGLHTLSLAEIGRRVARGEVIGAAGNSSDAESALGPHVHFELIVDGTPVEPTFSAKTEN